MTIAKLLRRRAGGAQVIGLQSLDELEGEDLLAQINHFPILCRPGAAMLLLLLGGGGGGGGGGTESRARLQVYHKAYNFTVCVLYATVKRTMFCNTICPQHNYNV